jgi:hypothetical protein
MDAYKLRPLREVSSEIWGRLEGQGLVNGLFRAVILVAAFTLSKTLQSGALTVSSS